jgi:hypothetical protein
MHSLMHIWIYGVRHVGQVGKPKKGDHPVRGTAESFAEQEFRSTLAGTV